MDDDPCEFCGLFDDSTCRDFEQSENCPHAIDYVPPEELNEIGELI